MDDAAASLVREFMDTWADRDGDGFGTFLSDDAVWVNGPRGVHRGVDEIKATFTGNLANTPFYGVDVVALVSDGNTVLVERVDHFEVGGHPIAMELVGVFEFDDAGRIKRWRDYYDLRSTEEEIKAAIGAQGA